MLVDMSKRMVVGRTYRIQLHSFGQSIWTEPMKCNSCTVHSEYSVSYFMSHYDFKRKANCGMYYWQYRTTLLRDSHCVIGFEEVSHKSS